MIATARTVEVWAGAYVVDGAVDGEEDGEGRVGAVIEGELGVGEVKGSSLYGSCMLAVVLLW